MKIQLITTSGSISGERLGTATGLSQSFMLKKPINDGNITIYANNSVLNKKNYLIQNDPQYITLTAPAGQIITASYSWVSETPTVYQFAAVLSQ